MPTDLQFNNIIKTLQRMHKSWPSLSFGTLLQVACDRKKFNRNIDLTDISSKQILLALGDYEKFVGEMRSKGKPFKVIK